MKSIIYCTVTVIFLNLSFIFAQPVFSSEIKELTASYVNHTAAIRQSIDRVICVDGLKVFQTIVFGYGQGSSASISNIQLYESKDGTTVPVKCEPQQK